MNYTTYFVMKQKLNIINKIYQISKHNIDKKHLLQCYFNHIIRFKLVNIDSNFIHFMKQTIHNINADMQDTIFYMISNKYVLKSKPYQCENKFLHKVYQVV